MAYAIQGFITRDPVVAALMAEKGPTVPLAQGYILLPLTDSLLSSLGVPFMAFDEADRPGQFMNIDSLGMEFSQDGKVAYVEGVELGGMSYQGAIAWKSDEVVYARSLEPGAIDLALSSLGVDGEKPGRDMFAALGLAKHKETNDWIDAS